MESIGALVKDIDYNMQICNYLNMLKPIQTTRSELPPISTPVKTNSPTISSHRMQKLIHKMIFLNPLPPLYMVREKEGANIELKINGQKKTFSRQNLSPIRSASRLDFRFYSNPGEPWDYTLIDSWR